MAPTVSWSFSQEGKLYRGISKYAPIGQAEGCTSGVDAARPGLWHSQTPESASRNSLQAPGNACTFKKTGLNKNDNLQLKSAYHTFQVSCDSLWNVTTTGKRWITVPALIHFSLRIFFPNSLQLKTEFQPRSCMEIVSDYQIESLRSLYEPNTKVVLYWLKKSNRCKLNAISLPGSYWVTPDK